MGFLSESYKKRLGVLAGLINEEIDFTTQDKTKAYEKSTEGVSGFSLELLTKAIQEGRGIGVLYKSSHMPVQKFRILLPVTLGHYKTKSGVPLKLSAYHLVGQSEKEARGTGVRSAEAKNVWRLFDLDTSKFKRMWLTDKFFDEYPPGYKKSDSRFKNIIEEFDVNRAIKLQQALTDVEPTMKPVDMTRKPEEVPTEPKAEPATDYKRPEEPGAYEEPLEEKKRKSGNVSPRDRHFRRRGKK